MMPAGLIERRAAPVPLAHEQKWWIEHVTGAVGQHTHLGGSVTASHHATPTVQRALGHSSASITLDTYSHLWPDASDRTRKAAADLVDAARRSPAAPLRTERTK